MLAATPDQDPILAAARTVIEEQGTNKATIAAVARQAGLSRMTVYRRFSSWDAILSALLSQELAELLEQATQDLRDGDTARERAVRAAVFLTDAIGRNALFRRVTEQEPQWLLPLLTTRFGQTQRAAAGELEQLLKSGMTDFGGDGSIRNDDPAVMALTCLMLSQPFVFAAPALADDPRGGRVRAELPVALSSYLSPQPTHLRAKPKE
ncbi:MAG: TetR/AcrR family transcriptional regulator [Actinomycetia bacterium]|nr:TetR/AcrR family transcriptional regulator [Actinomycetes bacterium]